jgi:hypothetical protein
MSRGPRCVATGERCPLERDPLLSVVRFDYLDAEAAVLHWRGEAWWVMLRGESAGPFALRDHEREVHVAHGNRGFARRDPIRPDDDLV